MSIDSIVQSVIQDISWHAHIIAPCLVPAPEKPSTAVPGCVENLPKEIASIVMENVFKQSKKDYGALVQTCTTVRDQFNRHFLESMERFPLYKTLLTCSAGDDKRVSAIFQRVFGLLEHGPVFFHTKELELALFDTSTKESLQSTCARFPNCTSLSILDKRTPVLPRAPHELILKWVFHADIFEPQEQSDKVVATVAAAVDALPELRELRFTYRAGRPLHVWSLASLLATRSASVAKYPTFAQPSTPYTITLSPVEDPTLTTPTEQ